jgi:predicted lipase
MRRGALRLYLITGVPLIAFLVATMSSLGPFPPRVVLMTTGTPSSGYDTMAERYQKFSRARALNFGLLVPERPALARTAESTP